ncbi:MAG: SDR family NAD(P)-dependent oxidoreductase [Bacteroidales bacterium]|nr:SDR family NAD(P)-dependent oxidoreductase [Candidatus Cryptobacteroides aphodequi]
MKKEIENLVEVSRRYGADPRFVIAGGGNTSYKDDAHLWVKASGHAMATIGEEGFAVLDRTLLAGMGTKKYSDKTAEREEQVKNDLADACITRNLRPSVETSLHNCIGFAYVVHTHPTIVNGLMCSAKAAELCAELFPQALYIEYTDPGYTLFKKVYDRIEAYKDDKGYEPQIIFLQNHGVFIGADSIEDIDALYTEIVSKLATRVENLPEGDAPICECISETIPAIRTILSRSGRGLKTLKISNSALINHFLCEGREKAILSPFTPDGIVYCKSEYIFLEAGETLVQDAEKAIEEYVARRGHTPKVLLIKGIGLVAVGDNAKGAQVITDVFTDAVKVAWYAASFGGQSPMTPEQIAFIDNWEVENYRRKVSATSSKGRVEGKTIIVTGAAQGFGEGIARNLMKEGANIVVADLNEAVGQKTADSFNALAVGNKAIFVKTNVADMESLANLIRQTVLNFGALDVFVSNAGVLRAGSLEAMTPENFEFVTNTNYKAYFFCAKVASHVMKIQTALDPEYFADIVQVNSKSGLRGSKANFAYAGGKFGGIGLTQSFALELAPARVKVNSICPGNFYDGPLWSNPENGLFVQYLAAGKVPGAKTVQDVKDFYLNQVPMHKGCNPEDVTKAILYAIDQTGETGQAIPVTGGQVMLA